MLASSAERDEVDVLISVINAAGLVDDTTGASGADDSKPAPDIVEVALTRAGLHAEAAVFVGDAVSDVHAADTDTDTDTTFTDPPDLLAHVDVLLDAFPD